MAKTIVATFDKVLDAERAAERLEDNGIDRRAIGLIDNSVGRNYESQYKGKSGGFWSWLFGDVESEAGRGFPSEDSAYYTEQLGRGAAFVTVTVADERAGRVSQLMEDEGAQQVRADAGATPTASTSAGATPTASTSAASAQGQDKERVVPVVEEQLKVGKRTSARGGVRIYTHTTQKPVEEHLRLREERIRVERRPVDRPVDTPMADAFREQTIELTESTEEPVVEKRARVVEEVVVGKDVRERDETVRDTVRRGEVEVQHTGGATGGFAAMEPEFRQHCTRSFKESGLSYEQCSPAYRFGYELGGSNQYRGDWNTVETQARRDWEQRHPGTWERFKAAIRYAWDRGRGAAQAA